MNEKKKLELLSKMYAKKQDVLNEHFIMHNYSFYQFFDENELTKDEYENILREAYLSGYVTVKLKSPSTFDGAIVKITEKGVLYVEENK